VRKRKRDVRRDYKGCGLWKAMRAERNRPEVEGAKWDREHRVYTVKKRFASFPSPARMSLPNSPWEGVMPSLLNYSCPGGVWLVTSRLETGNS
jgi:hypothetical protein